MRDSGEGEHKGEPGGRTGADRLESFVKFVGIMGGLIAAFVGVYQLWQGNVQSGRELRWKQAELAREMVNKMMADEGWKAMEMMDWEDEGRDYEIDGRKEKVNVHAVYAALE